MTMKDSKYFHSAVVSLLVSTACYKQDFKGIMHPYIKWRSLEEIISYLL